MPNPALKSDRISVKPDKLIRSEGNILIWMGDGDYKAPAGFKVLKGEKDFHYWNKTKIDWIERHPKINRIKGDPVDFEKIME